ncbi:Nuclear transcription factor Y subunit C-1-like protein [Drosera capensis]
MKTDDDVRVISAEAPVLFAKACELFILELTIRSQHSIVGLVYPSSVLILLIVVPTTRLWLHAEKNKRRTLQKNDIAAAITGTDIFDFLVDIVPRDEMKEEPAGLGMIGGAVSPAAGAMASGVPYYYAPMVQPPPGVMMGRPAIDPAMAGAYMQPPPSQAWQSIWQASDDTAFGGANAGARGGEEQGSLDDQS